MRLLSNVKTSFNGDCCTTQAVTAEKMGCFGGERPRTKAIPNIKLFEHELQRINQLMDQLKQLRNDVWRAVSRVFRTKNVRRLAQSVNSWFSKHFPGQPRRKSTSVGEDKPPLNMDQNAALLIKSCAEMFSQTNVPVTKPEANEVSSRVEFNRIYSKYCPNVSKSLFSILNFVV